MNFYESLIKTALLGTERNSIEWELMPEALQLRRVGIANNYSKEAQFLSLSALAMTYKNSGLLPIQDKFENLTPALAEDFTYCSLKARNYLRGLLMEENHPLLNTWLTQCVEKELIVTPEFLPKLFEIARNSLEYRSKIIKIMGNRGSWLLALHPFFKYELQVEIEDENWSELLAHGNLEQRLSVLKKLWTANPEEAVDYVKANWKAASAKEKVSYLDVWKYNVRLEDEEFLMTQLDNKAQSVRESTMEVVKFLPNSSLVQQFHAILSNAFSLKIETKLLVLKSSVIRFEEPIALNPAIFKYGIERESTDKAFSNPEFWVNQIIAQVNPTFWETHFSLEPAQIVKYFKEDKELKKFLNSMIDAAIKFENQNWATALFGVLGDFNLELIRLLSNEMIEEVCEKYATGFPNETMDLLKKIGRTRWSLKYSKQLMEYYSSHVYHFNVSIYKNVVPFLHKEVIKYMETLLSEQESYYPYWKNIISDIDELLEQREQMKQIW